ncbi:MAG: hypothetical protein K8H86_08970 [Ignavibacteriaceae bacterium]|nr:hypothetical protein [Ignavibacteriaceae bacterium]
MNTKILMIAAAIYLGIVGFGLIFLPQEIAQFFEAGANRTLVLALQILGALYLGFGMMNWMAKNNMIGGIYSRPLVFGNLLHFLVSAFALIRVASQYSENQFAVIITISIIYSIFTLCFGYLLRTNQIKTKNLV